jgi:hypothetical protein
LILTISAPHQRHAGSEEQAQINGLDMKAWLFNATFLAVSILATGGWVWLLYTSLKWAIVDS